MHHMTELIIILALVFVDAAYTARLHRTMAEGGQDLKVEGPIAV